MDIIFFKRLGKEVTKIPWRNKISSYDIQTTYSYIIFAYMDDYVSTMEKVDIIFAWYYVRS
jgi:superfamily II helicase